MSIPPDWPPRKAYWIFHKDGDDFDLKVSDPKRPKLSADSQRPRDGKHHRSIERPNPQPTGDTSEHRTRQEHPCEHHRGRVAYTLLP